ncbi:MAG: hypothetical protein AB7F59_12940 [Bdellovibrionales bacterium]
MKKIILISALLCFTATAFANTFQEPAQISRFQPWISVLRQTVAKHNTTSALAEALLNKEIRTATFLLEGLAKLYQTQDPFFKNWRLTLKTLEDVIGAYDTWNTRVKEAKQSGKSPQTIAEFQRRANEAKYSLETFLVQQAWVDKNGNSSLDIFEKQISQFAWKAYSVDREEMLSHLERQLTKINETTYDITVLEHGNGLHELRREIRWFLIQARSLNGLLSYDLTKNQSQTCPRSIYVDLLKNLKLVNDKYAKLPTATKEFSCYVSQCLVLALAETVAKLGDLKDAAEKIIHLSDNPQSDALPPQLIPQAQFIYQSLRPAELLWTLKTEIQDCH